MNNFIIPRRENILKFITPGELQNLKSITINNIPKEILSYVGEVTKLTYPQQGMCSLVSIIEVKERNYILKIAVGDYRGKELYAEYLAMKTLKNTLVPVPEVYMYFQQGDFSYLLREYNNGKQLSTLFNNNENEADRFHMIEEMAKHLKQIHSFKTPCCSYEAFINSQLYFAEQHMNNGTIDESEFVFDGVRVEPNELLRWLRENIPSRSEVCLIHGDYRPKNFLWNQNKLSSILDWAFCDIGDPYYDFAIFLYYLRDENEKNHFFRCYGLKDFDPQRLAYYEKMSPFINI